MNRMSVKFFFCVTSVLSVALFAFQAKAQTTQPAAVDDGFSREIDLAPLRAVSLQHSQTLKTLDTFSRQFVSGITGTARLNGQDPLYVMFDIAFRPSVWRDRRIIKIKNVPVRQDLIAELSNWPKERLDALLETGMISLVEYESPQVQHALEKIAMSAAFKRDAVQQVGSAAIALQQLIGSHGRVGGLMVMPLIPPSTEATESTKWLSIEDLYGNSPAVVRWAESNKLPVPQRRPGYDDNVIAEVINVAMAFEAGWQRRDAASVTQQAAELARLLPASVPERYPSNAKRQTEVIYNRFAKLTIPTAMLYFAAFAAFLVAARQPIGWLRVTGMTVMIIGFLVHTASIAIRWWLVEKSTGDWFHSIPIKNQFESVLFSAWFGALVGIILEIWKGKNLFGAAASFVGWLSLVAIYASPFVFKREIGAEISHVAGVLMSYWLYIHVTTVVASYALIGMSFLLGVWWLIAYAMRRGEFVNQPRLISADAIHGDIPVDRSATDARGFLATLDQCNLTVLQLAFWVLGVGIILGAVWADQSWGRPWGWDPKETFALVTWIVYLIVVHIRIVTPRKAFWTAVLSVVGFFVMLFNWIGVNFFLVGLHSYA